MRNFLNVILAYNQPLAAAYYLKEELRQLWRKKDKDAGQAYLDSWVERAKSSEISQLVKMPESLLRHRDGILAYFDHRITSGPMEATNAKTRVIQRQTYGIREQEYFKLRVKSLHECPTKLVNSK